MKKITSILLVALYATLTIGVLKSTHYCFGRVQSIQYFSSTSQDCFELIEDRQLPCCDDELELLQLEDEQNISQSVDIVPNWYVLGPLFYDLEYVSLITEGDNSQTDYTSGAPPPVSQEPVYIKYCSLTYYG